MADILVHFFKNLSFPTLQNARVFQMLQGRESLLDRQANKPKGQNQAQVDITDDGSSHKTASLIVSYKKMFNLAEVSCFYVWHCTALLEEFWSHFDDASCPILRIRGSQLLLRFTLHSVRKIRLSSDFPRFQLTLSVEFWTKNGWPQNFAHNLFRNRRRAGNKRKAWKIWQKE